MYSVQYIDFTDIWGKICAIFTRTLIWRNFQQIIVTFDVKLVLVKCKSATFQFYIDLAAWFWAFWEISAQKLRFRALKTIKNSFLPALLISRKIWEVENVLFFYTVEHNLDVNQSWLSKWYGQGSWIFPSKKFQKIWLFSVKLGNDILELTWQTWVSYPNGP